MAENLYRLVGDWMLGTEVVTPEKKINLSSDVIGGHRLRYIPLQAQKGDHAIFLRKDAIEIKFESEKYVVVPHHAILAIVRTI